MLPRVETLKVSSGVTLKKITQIGRTAAPAIAYSVASKRTTEIRFTADLVEADRIFKQELARYNSMRPDSTQSPSGG
jgi:hypothetical protein